MLFVTSRERTIQTPCSHEPATPGRSTGTEAAAGCAGWPVAAARHRVRMLGKRQQKAAVLMPATAAPSNTPRMRNAPHPALLLPVRSQSTHAADPPSSARNSGSFVPPEPTSQLASLWCDGAANHFLCFRSGARTGVQEGFHTMREGNTYLELGSRRPSSMPTCTDCPS